MAKRMPLRRSTWVVCALVVACSDSEAPSDAAEQRGGASSGAQAASEADGDMAAANEGRPVDDSAAPNEAANANLPLNPGSPGEPSDANAPAPDEEVPADGVAEGTPVQERLPDLLSVRQEHAVVALGGEIYVIGGFTPNVTATVEAFDPEGGSWRSVADLPVALHHANAAAIDGRLYVAGFYLGGSFTNADGRVFEYDPGPGSWSERGVMPAGTERASACVAAFAGRIYLFGGARAGSVADASAYDVATNSWQELPPLPQAREHCVAGEIGGNIYIAAGRSNGIAGFDALTWVFDPVNATYARRAPIATPRGGAAGAIAGGRLYVFGGEGNAADPSGVFANVEAYDPVTDSWQALPPMLEPRHGLAAAALADRIYLPGGATTQGFGAAGDHTVLSFDASAP
jgi:N-acetylneuraminic acid mutarotase